MDLALNNLQRLICRKTRTNQPTYLADVWDVKVAITIDFFEKGANVKRVSYCLLLRQYFTLFIEWYLD